MNVTQKTMNALQEIVDESFIMTAFIDRAKSVLGVKLAYNNTADLIHLHEAHWYSGFMGDMVGDLGLEGYNITVNYGNVPMMNKDYNSVKELLIELRDLTIDFQNKLNKCAMIAFENMDTHIFADLISLIQKHNWIIRQNILLVDKIELYKDNPSYDAHVKDWFNLLENNLYDNIIEDGD